MTDDTAATDRAGGPRLLGALIDDGGTGVVRLEDRFDTDVDDLWEALTDPDRLARWLGTVEGDLRVGGEFRAHWAASGWEGTCRVEACEPPHRLVVRTASEDQPDGVVEVTLRADGDATVLVLEDRGVPLEEIASYGAGDQVHLEDLAAHLAGGERVDARARWQELAGPYQELAVTTRG